jgi:hypothetical protein
MSLSRGTCTRSHFMRIQLLRLSRSLFAIVMLLLISQQALAFRCGNKLVKDGIEEYKVLQICGEPASVRHLGYAVRPYDIGSRRQALPGLSVDRYPAYGHFSHEVLITEYIYNFGPRKFMQRLMFEGGILVTIEPIGYGYIENKR